MKQNKNKTPNASGEKNQTGFPPVLTEHGRRSFFRCCCISDGGVGYMYLSVHQFMSGLRHGGYFDLARHAAGEATESRG